jgi:hypothetical protein
MSAKRFGDALIEPAAMPSRSSDAEIPAREFNCVLRRGLVRSQGQTRLQAGEPVGGERVRRPCPSMRPVLASPRRRHSADVQFANAVSATLNPVSQGVCSTGHPAHDHVLSLRSRSPAAASGRRDVHDAPGRRPLDAKVMRPGLSRGGSGMRVRAATYTMAVIALAEAFALAAIARWLALRRPCAFDPDRPCAWVVTER